MSKNIQIATDHEVTVDEDGYLISQAGTKLCRIDRVARAVYLYDKRTKQQIPLNKEDLLNLANHFEKEN